MNLTPLSLGELALAAAAALAAEGCLVMLGLAAARPVSRSAPWIARGARLLVLAVLLVWFNRSWLPRHAPSLAGSSLLLWGEIAILFLVMAAALLTFPGLRRPADRARE